MDNTVDFLLKQLTKLYYKVPNSFQKDHHFSFDKAFSVIIALEPGIRENFEKILEIEFPTIDPVKVVEGKI